MKSGRVSTRYWPGTPMGGRAFLLAGRNLDAARGMDAEPAVGWMLHEWMLMMLLMLIGDDAADLRHFN